MTYYQFPPNKAWGLKTQLTLEESMINAETKEFNFSTTNYLFTNNNTEIKRHQNKKISQIIVTADVISKWFLSHGYIWPFDKSGQLISLAQNEVKKNIDPRQKNNYLRLIAALIVIGKLPEKGASAAIEAQLLRMGFESPKERTIAKILSEINKLDRD